MNLPDLLWQPIATAPRDSTVILTNIGTACFMDKQAVKYGPYKVGFYLCTTGGSIPFCADFGIEASLIEPKYWTTLPQIPK